MEPRGETYGSLGYPLPSTWLQIILGKSEDQNFSSQAGEDSVPIHYLTMTTKQKIFSGDMDTILQGFIFPIHRDQDFQEKFHRKRQGNFQYPSDFIPVVDSSMLCQHGNQYDLNKLIKISDTILKIDENTELELKIGLYERPTVGSCKCTIQADTHDQVYL